MKQPLNFIEDLMYTPKTVYDIPLEKGMLKFIHISGYVKLKGRKEGWYNKRPTVKLQCKCGNVFHTLLKYYLFDKTQSCGCTSRRDTNFFIRKFTKKENKRYSAYTIRAKNKGIEFTINKNEFVKFLSNPCTYCGQTAEESIYGVNGIDRIDPTKGYSKDNCQSCCYECNIAKFTRTDKEFRKWIEKAYLNMKDLQRL